MMEHGSFGSSAPDAHSGHPSAQTLAELNYFRMLERIKNICRPTTCGICGGGCEVIGTIGI